jgi:hypothetical protein
MRAKYLTFPEFTPLVTDEEDFHLYIIIYDDTTDMEGDIRYDLYPVVRLSFKKGVVDSYMLVQEGLHAVPDFVGWDKKRMYWWLKDDDEHRTNAVIETAPHRYDFQIYRSPLVVE